ncbi:hypothetical protein ACQ4WX_50855 [Streptomyces lasalocidi]|uniref:hypothetical protein n=1 Tax=unclassified Streptomyces TaxID=2593676 RepID=UPI0015A53F9B|nr:hypothetical protein [Streptomyces sp. MUSC 14]
MSESPDEQGTEAGVQDHRMQPMPRRIHRVEADLGEHLPEPQALDGAVQQSVVQVRRR